MCQMKEPVCRELSVYYIRVAGLIFIHIRKLVSLSNSMINLGEMSTLSPRLFLYRNTRLLHILALPHTGADARCLRHWESWLKELEMLEKRRH